MAANVWDCTDAEYNADRLHLRSGAVNCYLDHGPSIYWDRYEQGHAEPTTDAMALGRLVHARALQPETMREFVVWRDGRRYGKKWDAAREAAAGRTIVTAEQDDLSIAVAASLGKHKQVAAILTTEQVLVPGQLGQARAFAQPSQLRGQVTAKRPAIGLHRVSLSKNGARCARRFSRARWTSDLTAFSLDRRTRAIST